MKRSSRWQSEQGVILVFVAIAMVVLIGFTTFVFDYGVLWVSRAEAQNSADAGALAVAGAPVAGAPVAGAPVAGAPVAGRGVAPPPPQAATSIKPAANVPRYLSFMCLVSSSYGLL